MLARIPERFDDPDRLADAIIERVGRDIVLALPLGLGKANRTANALFARSREDRSVRLRIFTALTLEKPTPGSELERRFIGPVIDRLFGDYPELAYAQALREGGLPPNIEVNEFFLVAGRWLESAPMQRNYISANYTHALDFLLQRGVNVVAQLVACNGTDENSRYSLGCNADITPDLLAARRDGRADFLFVGELNGHLPFMTGDAEPDAAEFQCMLEPRDGGFSLFAPPKQPVSLADHAAGLHIARLIADDGTLQIGIGSIADALVHALILRHRDNDAYVEILSRLVPDTATSLHDTSTFDKGLFGSSEMLVDSFLALYDAGILKRHVDGAVLEAAFFLGPRDFYRRLRDMDHAERALFAMRPVSWINQLHGDEIRKRTARRNARFVNNAMMATLLGAVVSDGLEDGRVISGVGGQYNFVAQAFSLDHARSIVTMNATRVSGGRTVSNVVWSYGHTTIPRHLRDMVVTEYGVADLRGRTDRDTIAAMLSVADSRFQPDLLEQAKRHGKIEPDYEIPAIYRDNTPQRIARALDPARRSGKLPVFPFGTDFTDVEQRLVPALQALKQASGNPLDLVRMAVAGLRAGRDRDALARMGLERPTTIRERLHATLISGALRHCEEQAGGAGG